MADKKAFKEKLSKVINEPPAVRKYQILALGRQHGIPDDDLEKKFRLKEGDLRKWRGKSKTGEPTLNDLKSWKQRLLEVGLMIFGFCTTAYSGLYVSAFLFSLFTGAAFGIATTPIALLAVGFFAVGTLGGLVTWGLQWAYQEWEMKHSNRFNEEVKKEKKKHPRTEVAPMNNARLQALKDEKDQLVAALNSERAKNEMQALKFERVEMNYMSILDALKNFLPAVGARFDFLLSKEHGYHAGNIQQLFTWGEPDQRGRRHRRSMSVGEAPRSTEPLTPSKKGNFKL